MNKTIFIIILVVITFQNYPCLGQRLSSVHNRDYSYTSMNDNIQSMFRYGFEVPYINLVLGYEQSLGKGFSILPVLGVLNATFSYVNNPWATIPVRISAKVYVRKYYNIDLRVAKKKNTNNNAFSYVGVVPVFHSKPLFYFGNIEDLDKENSSISFPVCWGIQRNLGRKVLLDFSVGLGVAYVLTSADNTKLGFNAESHLKLALLLHN